MITDIAKYDVIGAVDGKIQAFARGMTLDRAQTLKTLLDSQGIGGARDQFGGYLSGIQNSQTVTDTAVVRSYDTREATISSTTEELTVTSAASSADGSFQWELTNTVQGDFSLTVNGSGYPDVGASIVNDKYAKVFLPVLTVTDAVSATYTYKTTDDTLTGTDTLTDGTDIDGVATVFTLTYNYERGSVAVTSAPSGVYILEGGGNTIEMGRIDPTTGASTAMASGEGDVDLTYEYCNRDQTAIAAAEVHRGATDIYIRSVLPGTVQHPPFE